MKIVHRHYHKQKHSDRKQMENVYICCIYGGRFDGDAVHVNTSKDISEGL